MLKKKSLLNRFVRRQILVRKALSPDTATLSDSFSQRYPKYCNGGDFLNKTAKLPLQGWA